jgi:hypothetical protein
MLRNFEEQRDNEFASHVCAEHTRTKSPKHGAPENSLTPPTSSTKPAFRRQWKELSVVAVHIDNRPLLKYKCDPDGPD